MTADSQSWFFGFASFASRFAGAAFLRSLPYLARDLLQPRSAAEVARLSDFKERGSLFWQILEIGRRRVRRLCGRTRGCSRGYLPERGYQPAKGSMLYSVAGQHTQEGSKGVLRLCSRPIVRKTDCVLGARPSSEKSRCPALPCDASHKSTEQDDKIGNRFRQFQ